MSDDEANSKLPVLIIGLVILAGGVLWPLSAIWNAGGANPEHAEFLAEEAERECVLAGFPPRECPKLVGEHHLACIDRVEKRDEEGMVDRDAYIECMLAAFGEPPQDETDGAPPAAEEDSSGAEAAPTDADENDGGGDP